MPKRNKPSYEIFWGNTKPEAIQDLKQAAENAARVIDQVEGETLEQLVARAWACGFLSARDYHAESVALKMAGWPKVEKCS